MSDGFRGFKVSREIFSSLTCIDGRMEAMTQDERNAFIKSLYKNTVKLITLGVLVPVKISHNDTDERLKGSVLELYLKYKKLPTPHYVIRADMVLDPQTYSDYKAGRLPKTSVEIDPFGANIQGYTGVQSDSVLEYIQAVSLDGTTPVAQPFLERDPITEDVQYQVHYALRPNGNVSRRIFRLQEYRAMGDQLQDLKNAVMGVMAILNDMIGGDAEEPAPAMKKMEATPPPPAPPAPSPKMAITPPVKLEDVQKENEQLRAKLAKYEAADDDEDDDKEEMSKAFEKLHKKGFVLAEDKPTFFERAKKYSLAWAVDMYSAKRIETKPIIPPQNEKDKKLEQDWNDDSYRQKLRNLGFSDKAIDEKFKMMKQNNMQTYRKLNGLED